MEKKMENEMESGIIRFIGGILGLYWGYIGIMEKKMETTIMRFMLNGAGEMVYQYTYIG